MIAVLVIILGWCGQGCAPSDVSREYTIGFGNDLPLHFRGESGRPQGLAVELVQEAARRKGIRLRWVPGTGFNQRTMDFWVLMTVRPERSLTVHLTDPYLQSESCFIVPADGRVRRLEDLTGARIGLVNYAVHRDNISRYFPAAVPVPLGNSQEALAKLSSGEVDAAFINQYAVLTALLREGTRVGLRILPAEIPTAELALASTFATAHVADEIRDEMRAMAEDGIVTPIVERWAFFPNLTTDMIGDLAEAQRRVRWLAVGLVGVSVILGVTFWLALLSRRRTSQLRRTENLLQQIAARVPGVVYQFRVDPDGSSRFPYASEAIRQIYRVAPEEVRLDASKVFAVLHPDDLEKVRESIHVSARDLTPWVHEYRVKFPDGAVRWLQGNASPRREEDGATLWHGFITDITERKLAEGALAAYERKIQETQKLESLGILAGGIAHDFNNILTGILGNASLASMDVPLGSQEHESLECIKQGAVRAADLCKQMLAYAGKGRFVVSRLSLSTLIEETTQLLQLSVSKNAVLRFNLDPELPPIEADATQIRQVIMNLVINASEAIGSKSGVISVNTGLTRVDRDYLGGTILAPELPVGTYVHLEVCDTGCGMSPETQSRIFDPFFTTKFAGRGLGLAAVLGIVRGHRGALKVYSELNRGTTFKLLFPRAEGTADLSAARVLPAVSWRGQGCVLVVDDEETVRSTAAVMLRRLNFEVALAADGREALAVYQSNPKRFVAVLMDLTMPHMDGKEAFAELRRLRGNLPVVLMSGFNEQDTISQFTGKGLAGFLQKPFQFEDLMAVMRATLSQDSDRQ
ncbi:MAG: transporter substrate-binding domain-containing protein [Opitutaceae bacterium]